MTTMTTHRLLIALGVMVTLLLSGHVSAIQRGPWASNQYILNGRVFDDQVASFTCQGGEPTVIPRLKTNKTVIRVECYPPRVVLQKTLIGYAPLNVRQQILEVCLMDHTGSTTNATNADALHTSTLSRHATHSTLATKVLSQQHQMTHGQVHLVHHDRRRSGRRTERRHTIHHSHSAHHPSPPASLLDSSCPVVAGRDSPAAAFRGPQPCDDLHRALRHQAAMFAGDNQEATLALAAAAAVGGGPGLGLAVVAMAAIPFFGGDSDEKEAIDKLKKQVDNLVSQVNALNEKQQEFRREVSAQLTDLEEDFAADVAEILEDQQKEAAAALERDGQLMEANRALAQKLDEDVDQIYATVAALDSAVRSEVDTLFSGLAGATREELGAMTEAMQASAVLTENRFVDLIRQVNHVNGNMTRRTRSLAQNVRDLTAVIWDLYNQKQIRRMLTGEVAITRRALESVGYRLFAGEQGQAPIDPVTQEALYRSYSKTNLETVRTTWLAVQNGQPYVQGRSQTLVCDTAHLLNHGKPWFTWEDIVESLGPVDCARDDDNDLPASTDGSSPCLCWIKESAYACPMKTETLPGDSSETLKDRVAAFQQTPAWGGLTYLGETTSPVSDLLCAGPTTRVADQAVALTLSSWHGSLWETCNAQRSSLLGDRILVYGERMQTGLYGGVTFHSDVCQPSSGPGNLYKSIYDAAPGQFNGMETLHDGDNIIAATYTLFTQGYSSFARNSWEEERVLFGALPNGLQTKSVPFNTDLTGSASYRCEYASLIGIEDTPFAPVYALQPKFIPARAVVKDLATGEYLDVQDAVASLPAQSLIPDQLVVFGELVEAVLAASSGDEENSVVYDVPTGEASLSPLITSREGHATYFLTPTPPDNPDQGTFDDWKKHNGPLFDAFQAANSAGLYKRGLKTMAAGDSSDIVCDSPAQLDGPICQLLRWFKVSLVDEDGDGEIDIVLLPRDFTLAFTLSVPNGPMTETLFSTCPTLSFTERPLAGTTAIVVTNPNGGRTSFEVHQEPSWPAGADSVLDSANVDCRRVYALELGPHATTTLVANRCVSSLTGDLLSLTVTAFALEVGADGNRLLSPCGQGTTVEVRGLLDGSEDEDSPLFGGIVGREQFTSTTLTETDVTTSSLMDLTDRLTQAIQTLSVATKVSLEVNGLDLSALGELGQAFDQVDDLLAESRLRTQNMSTHLQAQRADRGSAVEATSEGTQLIEQSIADSKARQANTTARLEKLKRDNADRAERAKRIANITNTLGNMTEEAAQAWTQFADSLNKYLDTQDDDDGGDIFGGILGVFKVIGGAVSEIAGVPIDLFKEAVDAIGDVGSGALSWFDRLINGLLTIGIIVLVAVGAYLVYKYRHILCVCCLSSGSKNGSRAEAAVAETDGIALIPAALYSTKEF